MATIYVTQPHSTVRQHGEALLVETRGADGSVSKLTAPLIDIDQVVVYGTATITGPALHHLLERNIDVALHTTGGRFRGRLSGEMPKHAPLRVAQHAASADPARQLAIARACITGKLKNMRVLLLRQARAHDSAASREAATAIDALATSLAMVTDTGQLMGKEGAASAAYFAAFREIIPAALAFPGRRRRPPTDPVNALLSFVYTMLTNAVTAAVNTTGLDPYIGFLHSVVFGRPALALDLVEEFRPVIGDSIVLTLVNNRMITAEDGELDAELGWRLSDRARRTVIQQFEEKLAETIKHPRLGIEVSYRRCLELQVRQLCRVLSGDDPEYLPFRIR